MHSDTLIRRARALIGAPFRLHGRDPETGLDCVGLIACATGRVDKAPCGYSLRSCGGPQAYLSALDAFGTRLSGPVPGCVLLLHAGPAQAHLGLFSGSSLIHADAGLRRVVETPLPLPWPIAGAWQIDFKD